MIKIKIKTGREHYPVYIQKGVLAAAGAMVRSQFTPRPVLVVTDKIVAGHYGEPFRQSLLQEGFYPFYAVLESGEKAKTLPSASKLYDAALEAGLDREGIILALGGGVVGDLAGFVAATYMRGLPFIQIPTTLLAMVDSSVGGKVAVNHPRGKNIIGSFHQPAMVIVDPDLLKTLPQRELASGLAELLKYGLVLDQRLFTRLEQSANLFKRGEAELLESLSRADLSRLIARALFLKGKVVSRDERESSYRRLLNFGHTFGHALEAATDYGHYLHGEAVAVGMMAAAWLSYRLKMLSKREYSRIFALLSRLNPPPAPAGLTPEMVLQAMRSDKKRRQGEIGFVLLSAIGQAAFYSSPPPDLLLEAAERCLAGTPFGGDDVPCPGDG